MKILLHDLAEKEIEQISFELRSDVKILTQTNKKVKTCIGCFGCWIKNPGECVLKDGFEHMGEYLGNCDEFIIITDSRYGEFSPFTKTLIDRSLPICHPYFEKREGMMHHKLRYKNEAKMTVYCYSGDITSKERKTFENRCQAMAINFGLSDISINFIEDKENLMGVTI